MNAVWCVIGNNGNKKIFGLAVAESENPTAGATVTAYNRHGATQVKVLGALATNPDGSAMTRTVMTTVNGIPTQVKQAIFTVQQ